MPRAIEVSASPQRIDAILERIGDLPGVVSLARQPGASLKPPGDVLSIHLTNEATRPVMRVLKDLRVASEGAINTSEPASLMSWKHQAEVNREANETTWDEMAFMLRTDANPSPNFIFSMALAGAIAAGGLWTGTLHLIVGAMIIAPAFEPLVRVPFGFITGARNSVSSGLIATGAGYLALALGAALVTAVLELWDPGPGKNLNAMYWVDYWSTLSFPSILISALGGIAGGVIISGQRSVMTTGVMITLALIPSMAIVGMGMVVGDLALAGRGLVRWAVDVALVMAMSTLVFGLKQRFLHRGASLS